MIAETPNYIASRRPGLAAALPAGRVFAVTEPEFERDFDRQPFLLPHRLADHPLFTLPSLIELARRLPPEFVEYNAGNLPVSQDWKQTPQTGLSIEETIRRIEECCSWMVLKRVEQDPAYREVLDVCLDELQPLCESRAPGMYERAGAIFISSPGSVTPFHMDHEYNFLLQMRGQKTVHVFDPLDRSVLSEKDLEDYFTRTSIDRNLVFRPEYQARAQVFELARGFALHIPSTAPHWVKNGEAVSISFSAGFYSRVSYQRSRVYKVNHVLRRFGLQPEPPGRSAWRDSLKLMAARIVDGWHWLRGEPDRQFVN